MSKCIHTLCLFPFYTSSDVFYLFHCTYFLCSIKSWSFIGCMQNASCIGRPQFAMLNGRHGAGCMMLWSYSSCLWEDRCWSYSIGRRGAPVNVWTLDHLLQGEGWKLQPVQSLSFLLAVFTPNVWNSLTMPELWFWKWSPNHGPWIQITGFISWNAVQARVTESGREVWRKISRRTKKELEKELVWNVLSVLVEKWRDA